MSLDIYLTGREVTNKCTCPHCGDSHYTTTPIEYYEANITHNLGKMAREAGIYKHLWRPEEISIGKAGQLIKPLTEGLALLNSDQVRFERFDPENKWGNYEGLVKFVSNYLAACKEYPEATITISR